MNLNSACPSALSSLNAPNTLCKSKVFRRQTCIKYLHIILGLWYVVISDVFKDKCK